MEAASFSLVGPKGVNQDRVVEPFDANGGWIAAIADGVGGSAGGEVAAEIATSMVRESGNVDEPIALYDAICARIRLEAERKPQYSDMATTLSVVGVRANNAIVAHVGDARVYHVRGNGIVTRTQDQTEVALLLREKVLTPRQAREYPRRNVITSSLSAEHRFELYSSSFEVRSGDLIILLTDGAYGAISKSEIVNLHVACPSVESFVSNVEGVVLNRGLRDDSSLVAVRLA